LPRSNLQSVEEVIRASFLNFVQQVVRISEMVFAEKVLFSERLGCSEIWDLPMSLDVQTEGDMA
jgi:hypothetical protein